METGKYRIEYSLYSVRISSVNKMSVEWISCVVGRSNITGVCQWCGVGHSTTTWNDWSIGGTVGSCNKLWFWSRFSFRFWISRWKGEGSSQHGDEYTLKNGENIIIFAKTIEFSYGENGVSV